MGMTIEEHIKQLKKLKSFHNGSYGASINYAIDTMRKYQKIAEIVGNYGFDTSWLCLKKYEVRLKADLEAILVELQMEIEELRLDRPLFSRGYECYGQEDKTPTEIQQECSDIIQDKINELKRDKNEV